MSQAWIHMGPQHPITHGLWTFKILTDGENIVDAECLIGYLHRCFEKIAENRNYVQYVPITDRLCYVAGLSQAYSFVSTVEEALGVSDQIPERVEYIRIIILEMQRIISHLVWLAAYAADVGVLTMLVYPFRDREYLLDIIEHLAGARMMPHYFRIGGVAKDLYPGFEEDLTTCLDYLEDRFCEYRWMLDESEIFNMRTKGVGILPKDEAVNRGATGPVLRGSGVKADIRRLEPYSIYDRFDFDIPMREEGDCLARYQVRMEEMEQSVRIIRQALNELPSGEIGIRVPRRVPPTTIYSRIEDPRGERALYLISGKRHETKGFVAAAEPWRLKIRSAAYSNLSIAPYMSIGGKLADLPVIIASIDLCIGEVDR